MVKVHMPEAKSKSALCLEKTVQYSAGLLLFCHDEEEESNHLDLPDGTVN